MQLKPSRLTAVVSFLVFCLACSKMDLGPPKQVYLDLPSEPYNYMVPAENAHVPTLGRVLFYDKQLSINNSVSCGSCHKQAFAFTDNARFSVGFENRLTTRNSMPIQNLLQGSFIDQPSGFPSGSPLFWDGREQNLNKMVLLPTLNHLEMGMGTTNQLVDRLKEVPYYKDLFSNAFGSQEITVVRISLALTMFVSSITSRNTRMDRHELLTQTEADGMRLFVTKYKCDNCHKVEDPHGYIDAGTFANVGLDKNYTDNGLGNVSSNSADNGKFKIPSLRNVVVTAPFMHDGRFNTLSDVLDHYSEGINDHPNLDQRLRQSNGQPLRLEISAYEKQAIIAFLGTLTDQTMLTDVKFSDPFKVK